MPITLIAKSVVFCPPKSLASADSASPTVYPEPPSVKSTLVTKPFATVISAFAPVPVPVVLVSETPSYTNEPVVGL